MSVVTTQPAATEAISEELRFRLEKVAAYYRRCGEFDEAPDPDFIDRELADGTRNVLLAATPSRAGHQAAPAAAVKTAADASGRPASPKQVAYVKGLLEARAVPATLRRDVESRLRAGLTHGDCLEVIPKLKGSPRGDWDDVDWTSPEGYDESPDMGVHRYDGA